VSHVSHGFTFNSYPFQFDITLLGCYLLAPAPAQRVDSTPPIFYIDHAHGYTMQGMVMINDNMKQRAQSPDPSYTHK
jgi:hypothetical protein